MPKTRPTRTRSPSYIRKEDSTFAAKTPTIATIQYEASRNDTAHLPTNSYPARYWTRTHAARDQGARRYSYRIALWPCV